MYCVSFCSINIQMLLCVKGVSHFGFGVHLAPPTHHKHTMPSCGKSTYFNSCIENTTGSGSYDSLKSIASFPNQSSEMPFIQKARCYHHVSACYPSPLCGASLMSLACKVIPALDDSVPRITIILHSSGKPLKMQWNGGVYLVPQRQCIGSIQRTIR